MTIAIWLGIVIVVSQSAIFSGLNLAFFSLSRMMLEIEAGQGNAAAAKVLNLRKDSNFLLTTILWGNVGANVLLTLLTDSVLSGVAGFVFSTVVITLLGEIGPQAYFSRQALKVASILAPVLKFYQVVLYPVAKPTAMALDRLVGAEVHEYLQEKSLKDLIIRHINSPDARDIDRVEGLGAINFLTIDDVQLKDKGTRVNPKSVISLEFPGEGFYFPEVVADVDDPLVSRIAQSGEKWVIFVDEHDLPRYVLDADGYLRALLFEPGDTRALDFCHEPIVVERPDRSLGSVLEQFSFSPEFDGHYAINNDVILLWHEKERRIITGADILGRLLKGIAQ